MAVASVAPVASLMLTSSAVAASATWNLNNSGSWVTDANWNPAAAPGATTGTTNGDTATFGNIINAGRTITVDANRNILNIDFNGNSSGYTLSGGSLFLSAGGTVQTSGGGSVHTDTILSAISLAGSYTFATNSSSTTRILSIGTTVASLETSGVTTLTLEGAGTSASNAITGAISNGTGTNAVAITKNGAGHWTLSGANTFTGDVTLNNGTLRGVNTGSTNVLSAFGTGNTINLNGGTLQLKANGAGNGGQTIAAGNTVTSGSNAVTIDVNQNTTNSGNTIAFGNLSIGTGQLNVTGGNTYALRFAGTTTLTGNATFNPTTANMTLAGAVGDGGNNYSLTKVGTGTLALSGSNTYTGVTSVLGGTLSLGSASPSGSAGALGNATSAVLLGDPTAGVNATLTTAAAVGRNIVVQSGNAPVATIGSSVTTSYSGAIILGTASSTGHGVTLTNTNGSGFSTTTFSGAIQDPTAMTGSGGLVTIAPGTNNSISLTGNNTYSGGTLISGTAGVNSSTAFGTGTVTFGGGGISIGSTSVTLLNNNAMTWNGNVSMNSSGGSLSLGNGAVSMTASRSISVGINGLTVGGNISESGGSYSLTYRSGAGTTNNYSNSLTLNGANTFSGGFLLDPSNGQVQLYIGNLGSTSSNSAIGTGALTIVSGTKTATVNNASSAGTLATNNALNLNSDVIFTGSNLSFGSGAVSLGTSAAATRTITANNVLTLNGVISNGTNVTTPTTALTKAGTGTLRLGGANLYTGLTSITAGTLVATSTTALTTTSGLSVGATGTFNFATGSGGTLALGPASGTALTLVGGSTIGSELGGTITLQAGATASAAGAVKVNVFGISHTDGVFALVSAAGGGLTSGGATYSLGLVYNATDFSVSAPSATNTNITVTTTAQTALTTAFWKGGLTNATTVWAASNGSNASNWTTDSAGSLATGLVPGSGANVTFSTSNASSVNQVGMVLGANMSFNGLTITNTNPFSLNDDGNTLTVGAGNISVNTSAAVTFNAPLAGVASLTKSGSGTLSLTGKNSYSGATQINAGIVSISLEGSINSSSGVTLNGGELNYNSITPLTRPITFTSGTLSGTGKVTDVSAGSGGFVRPGGTSATGVIGTLSTDNLALNSGSTFAVDINLATALGKVYQSDTVNVTGTVTLDGDLFLTLVGGPTGALSPNKTVLLINNDGTDAVSGTFTNISPSTSISGPLTYAISYTYDAATNSFSGGNDVAITFSSVPEPTSLGIIGLGAVGLLSRRRRRQLYVM